MLAFSYRQTWPRNTAIGSPRTRRLPFVDENKLKAIVQTRLDGMKFRILSNGGSCRESDPITDVFLTKIGVRVFSLEGEVAGEPVFETDAGGIAYAVHFAEVSGYAAHDQGWVGPTIGKAPAMLLWLNEW